jgi:hypothetical protein
MGRANTCRRDLSIFALSVWLMAAPIALGCVGCRPAGPGGGGPSAVASPEESPEAPKGEAIADPVLREGREQAEAILEGLLAGKFNQDPYLALLENKLKGYTSSSIKLQKMVREGAADFDGTLSGAAGQAVFQMTLVKQANGKWEVGGFSGPNRE